MPLHNMMLKCNKYFPFKWRTLRFVFYIISWYHVVVIVFIVCSVSFIVCSVSFIVCSVSYIVCIVLCALFVWVWCVILCDVCYLCVVSYCSTLPPGKNPFAVKINNNNNNVKILVKFYWRLENATSASCLEGLRFQNLRQGYYFGLSKSLLTEKFVPYIIVSLGLIFLSGDWL
jgi:hypothetical protein